MAAAGDRAAAVEQVEAGLVALREAGADSSELAEAEALLARVRR
jgi:hypothetical protein